MADKEYFERNADGEPIKFVQVHDSHPHNGKCPHGHEVDLRVATIADTYDKRFNELRKDRDID
jgi:hypothetical protein